MSENFREKWEDFTDSVRQATTSVSDSMSGVMQDLKELRDIFVNIRDTVASVFAFMGHETSVLILCTIVFLFVINLIPFFFFDKKHRYIAGICFGVFVGIWFSYTFLAVVKFICIMLLPVAVEFLLAWVIKKVGFLFKKAWVIVVLMARKMASGGVCFLKKGLKGIRKNKNVVELQHPKSVLSADEVAVSDGPDFVLKNDVEELPASVQGDKE